MKCYDCKEVFTKNNPVRVDSFGKYVCKSCKAKLSLGIKQMIGAKSA